MLQLGTRRDVAEERVELPVDALLRHVLALGSSGSGKTVFCKVVVEEAVASGIPVIAVDPQGDLVSLALAADDAELVSHGIDPDAARRFRERADVVVFTPASRRGIPLCADPVDGDTPSDPAEAIAARTRVATMVTSLLGYDPGANDGEGLVAVFDHALDAMARAGREPSLASLTEQLDEAAASSFEAYARFLDPKKVRGACQRLARLSVGARRLLFQQGVPIDVETMLGTGASPAPDRVRIAIVYLNTLHSQEDKDLIVATLADRLYRYMLRNPSPTPQALFYVDEVAPFVPPVRKPACKEGLTLLLKQARKYGVCCLMATQNPGDVDYRAMGQFGTWALGRLSTRQDLKKIEPSLRALAPGDVDAIVAELPRLGPGELLVASPDRFDAPVPLATRWLYSAHRTLDEGSLGEVVTSDHRLRFAPLERDAPGDDDPTRAVVLPEAPAAHDRATVESELPPPPTESTSGGDETSTSPRTVRPPPEHTADVDLADAPERDEEHERWIEIVAEVGSGTVKELADRGDSSASKARRILNELVETGRIARFKDGRSYRYWATSSGARPDLDLGSTVVAVAAVLGPDEIEALAQRMARGRIFGILGDAEHFDAAELIYRPLYRVDFEEKVPAPVLQRFLGSKEDLRAGSVYLHPKDLRVLVLHRGDGLSFVDAPGGHASAVDDLDGVATFVEVPPGTLPLDADAWTDRAGEEKVRARFTELFEADAKSVSAVFLPLWRLRFDKGKGRATRLVWIDALLGKPVTWP